MNDSGDRTAGDPQPTLLLVTADLFLGSRLQGFAERAGYRVVMGRSTESARDILAEPAGRAVIDLAAPQIDLEQLVESVPAAIDRIAAYAPHVRLDLLKAARAAGLAAVFTRGQLDSELPRWLRADFGGPTTV